MSEGDDSRMNDEQFTMKLNQHLVKEGAMSDDEVSVSPGKSGSKKNDFEDNNQYMNTSKKAVPQSSMDVANQM